MGLVVQDYPVVAVGIVTDGPVGEVAVHHAAAAVVDIGDGGALVGVDGDVLRLQLKELGNGVEEGERDHGEDEEYAVVAAPIKIWRLGNFDNF